MRIAAIALLSVLAVTSACTIGAERDTRAKTPHETCMASCDRDFNICMDESSNNREIRQGMGRQPNAGRGCDASLKSCQSRCRGL